MPRTKTRAHAPRVEAAEPITYVYVVTSPCDCDSDGYCFGDTDIAVFTSEQTALQEADLRSKRYGGHGGRPDMHINKVKVSTKISG